MDRDLPAPVAALIAKGVEVRAPWSVDIGPEVDPDRVSGDGVVIHPGCRISGARTVLSAGVTLGAEGPVTLVDCHLGPGVALKGGYAADSVFLDGASLGLGHHVREGTLLEEQANGAHCVGLKQTILLPYVTLGSLINFCDCLMAGGRSRRDHSEVGSSYIHFNFTPEGDKATPSLFGDVPRGVLLREPPIFLGGQGGSVGPVQVAYGTVVGAGSILRSDVPVEGQLVVVGPPPSIHQPFTKGAYRTINRSVARNIEYLANLRALRLWYERARTPFFRAQPLGELVLEGALELVDRAWAERTARLLAMVDKVEPSDELRQGLHEHLAAVLSAAAVVAPDPARPAVLEVLEAAARAGTAYLDAVHALDGEHAAGATQWLQSVTAAVWGTAQTAIPGLRRLPHPS